MIVLDWRGASPGVVAAVFERERERWLQLLHWDPARAFREVEQARTTWGLPGLIALDDQGRALGSIFYLPDSNRFDIGGVTADSAAVTAALLDSVMARAASEAVDEVRCFVFESAPNLGRELTCRGFHVERYLYLSAALCRTGLCVPDDSAGHDGRPVVVGDAIPAPPPLKTDTWHPADVTAIAALLQQSYDRDSGRIFAPQGTPEEWERYLRNLVEHGACGDLNTSASRILRVAGQVVAAAVVTSAAPRTAHLAQFAVHPVAQGKGLARAVLREVWLAAAQHGFEKATLLVAESNRRARALYASLGLRPVATFLAASTVLPTTA
jgi:ribosomal protein S18 acetylase RimI-like enzyme